MPPKSPAEQLITLCSSGAVPTRIETAAPFMRDLTATKHAVEVLYDGDTDQWTHAASELLMCVCRAGGAARFDEEAARFVAACLDLESTQRSLSSRMYDLANDPDFTYPTAPKTHAKRRTKYMTSLAGVLIGLDRYPCAPLTHREKRLKIAVGLVHEIVEQLLEVDPEDQVGWSNALTEVWDQLQGARAQFERYMPRATDAELLRILVGAVVGDQYVRGMYDEARRNLPDIVDVTDILGLLNGAQIGYLPLEEELQRSCEVLAEVLLEVEAQGVWGDVVQRLIPGQDAIASIEDPDDDLDLPWWLK